MDRVTHLITEKYLNLNSENHALSFKKVVVMFMKVLAALVHFEKVPHHPLSQISLINYGYV